MTRPDVTVDVVAEGGKIVCVIPTGHNFKDTKKFIDLFGDNYLTSMEKIQEAIAQGVSMEINTYDKHHYQLRWVQPARGWSWFWAELEAGRDPWRSTA